MAAQKWSRELWKEKRQVERVANLKWVLTYPWTCIASALSPASAEPRCQKKHDNPDLGSLNSDESVPDCCE